MAPRDDVCGLVAERIAEVNADLAADPMLARCRIHRFAILPRELSAGDGLLTRTGKVRRAAVAVRTSTSRLTAPGPRSVRRRQR